MSIDLEGFEAPALRRLESNKFNVRYICVEVWNIAAILQSLNGCHEIAARLSHIDYLFKRHDAAA